MNAIPEKASREQRLELALSTVNIFTLSLLLLLMISFLAYIVALGVPTDTVLDMDELNRLPWLPYLAFGVSFIGVPILAEYRRGFTWKEMGLLPGQDGLVSIGLGLLVGLLWFFGVAIVSSGGRPWEVQTGSTLAAAVLLGNYFAVAVGEEVLIRVLVQRRFTQVVGPVGAIVISGLLFSFVMHMSNPFLSNLLYRLPGSLALGYLFHRRRTLWAPVAAHWLYNSMPALLTLLR
jgi:membrane protease YdiL (CAAX protease family)